jgi:hypothetical protein
LHRWNERLSSDLQKAACFARDTAYDWNVMDVVEYPIGAGRTAGFLRCFHSAPLSDVVEAILDCEVSDGELAKSLTIKLAPGISVYLIGQYRRPAKIRRRTTLLPAKCATHIQSDPVTLRPIGSLGLVIVRLRCDAAHRIVKAPVKEFANSGVLPR